ncbi:MAG: pyruvate formate lyase-activating protein [Ruminococcus sp.]|nr:pyruvate formate lyase-activating protein [Ruminococcus sp.]
MYGNIHSTDSFGTVDGPGIRFVIFFQGCPMRCLYCHNPDTWAASGGRKMTAEELLREYESVREFMRGGGITCTGGEPCLQLGFLTELFEKAHERGIHTCLDTSGVTFSQEKREEYERLLRSTDLVMLDIKHIDGEEHRKLTGQGNENILEFARFISERGVPLWIRHVIVPGITDREDELYRLGRFLSELKTLKAIDVLPYHTMGKAKYEALGLAYPLGNTPPFDKEKAPAVRDIIMKGLKDALRERRAEK